MGYVLIFKGTSNYFKGHHISVHCSWYCCGCFVFKLIFLLMTSFKLFIYLKSRVRNNDRWRHCQLLVSAPSADNSGTLSWSPLWVAGTQSREPLLLSPCMLKEKAGIWISVAGTQIQVSNRVHRPPEHAVSTCAKCLPLLIILAKQN